MKTYTEAEREIFEEGRKKGFRQAVSNNSEHTKKLLEKQRKELTEDSQAYQKGYAAGFIAGKKDLIENLKNLLEVD